MACVVALLVSFSSGFSRQRVSPNLCLCLFTSSFVAATLLLCELALVNFVPVSLLVLARESSDRRHLSLCSGRQDLEVPVRLDHRKNSAARGRSGICACAVAVGMITAISVLSAVNFSATAAARSSDSLSWCT